MEQISEQITQELLQELPDQAQFFTPEELLTYGIPYIVAETLRKNVLSAINSELQMPESEWVKPLEKEVRQAWQDFVEISMKHLRIPASKLSHLLEEAVEECLELALRPRQSLPDIIFRTHDIIEYQTAKDRVQSLEVNKQLGLALVRYMEKKQKDEISIDQARELITKVDQRLVENYHPLNWAQVLKPVFDLAGTSVDTELFRIFFEDKEKPGYARKFEQLEGNLNDTELIEVLSSADVLDIEDEDQPELFVQREEKAEKEKEVENEESFDEEEINTADESETEENSEPDQEEFLPESSEDLEESEPEPVERMQSAESEEVVDEEEFDEELDEPDDPTDLDGEDEKSDRDENIVDLFSEIREDDLFEETQNKQMISVPDDEDDVDEDPEKITLLSKFTLDENVEDSPKDLTESAEEENDPGKDEPSSIYDEMNLVKEDLTEIQEQGKSFNDFEEFSEDDENEEELSFKIETQDKEKNESDEVESFETDSAEELTDEDEKDQPMWRSFLERDDLETDSGYEYEDESEKEPDGEFEQDFGDDFAEEEDEGYIEEPIYDLTAEQQDPDEKIENISGWLDDEKDRFVDEIFKGSEMAYEQALLDIMDYDNWKSASMYLEKEVFSRNNIDVYDEAAVDFTDRLHSFFLENNS
ncbi:hypothetical protein [Rhodohalobacter sulfatireducens]|uniref:Uncharacterized protein n=1 Tax=Rhodohalobacter sulfatireducens TaxID=2911366 RepID=A0ABS9KEP3_9BACT|nr:hypothetical protein [Rhodohalobacter sulfatireducens]MCG2589296.1 hypothetical protein [Rhodohalobacter sulfatireducens]